MDVNRQTDENGKPVAPILADDPYSWVKGEVREQVSLFRDMESVAELGEPMLWVREGKNVGLEFLPCGSGDRVFHKGEGWEYFYMYTMVFIDLGVRFPFSEFENAEEHFQSKTDFDLIESVDDIARAQFMQVYAARLLCIGRYDELKARKEVALKEKELLDFKSENEELKRKVEKLEKDKTGLEARVVELCVQKKEAETSKEHHGYEMLVAGFERARKQAGFFFP
ncbi:hypothetical protein PIB30_060487 [Stylosanthes scabra]|uniref:Uncharacterized protein n=1 Tax=Stylosanthes scabra TaxID=79078 RepID=A0ABU6UNK7_9FABA|nr:hypothetical protein [Stylosanthes scabra]